ncbi:conserved hypothetical protein [Trichinella spiralis]|uniref:hypothetical protein n=1 Tax=Trichinella spiralis TaxID=6334 RepID=UPI0001EFDA22|nr:conserved hypothetical protein [Trichinella spiralis]
MWLASFLLLLRNNRWKRLNFATRGLAIFFWAVSRAPWNFMGSLRPDKKAFRKLLCNSLMSTMAIPVASLIRSHDITAPYSGYVMLTSDATEDDVSLAGTFESILPAKPTHCCVSEFDRS